MLTVEGNLMLAIQARSFNHYFYLQSSNVHHPTRFVQNKVTGILFESKVDYTSMYIPSISHIPSPIKRYTAS
jgi:endo-1,3(4)-beta-glucanase